MKTTPEAPFKEQQSWEEKVFQGDKIWAQVKAALDKTRQELPKTPRRPDVRLVIENNSGQTFKFLNPGNHGDDPSTVPSESENGKTATMVMLHGNSLGDQMTNAFSLTQKFNLGEEGLTQAVVDYFNSPEAELDGWVKEAYGPAVLTQQTDKMVDVTWTDANGETSTTSPIFGKAAAFGARPAANEAAIRTTLRIKVQGTTTAAENMEIPGMIVVVDEDWKTKQEVTKPIVPSVAINEDFYGHNYLNIPEVVVSTDGQLQSIDLKNGFAINVDPQGNVQLIEQEAVRVAKNDNYGYGELNT